MFRQDLPLEDLVLRVLVVHLHLLEIHELPDDARARIVDLDPHVRDPLVVERVVDGPVPLARVLAVADLVDLPEVCPCLVGDSVLRPHHLVVERNLHGRKEILVGDLELVLVRLPVGLVEEDELWLLDVAPVGGLLRQRLRRPPRLRLGGGGRGGGRSRGLGALLLLLGRAMSGRGFAALGCLLLVSSLSLGVVIEDLPSERIANRHPLALLIRPLRPVEEVLVVPTQNGPEVAHRCKERVDAEVPLLRLEAEGDRMGLHVHVHVRAELVGEGAHEAPRTVGPRVWHALHGELHDASVRLLRAPDLEESLESTDALELLAGMVDLIDEANLVADSPGDLVADQHHLLHRVHSRSRREVGAASGDVSREQAVGVIVHLGPEALRTFVLLLDVTEALVLHLATAEVVRHGLHLRHQLGVLLLLCLERSHHLAGDALLLHLTKLALGTESSRLEASLLTK